MCPPRYLFDRWGTYIGKIDESGAYFDAKGYRVGQFTGRDVYGCDGTHRGWIDVVGQYWSERGQFLGYVRPGVPARTCATQLRVVDGARPIHRKRTLS